MRDENDYEFETTELDCPACGYDHVLAGPNRTAVCPKCDETYSLIRHDGFAMIEMDGWITRVAVDRADEPISGVVDG